MLCQHCQKNPSSTLVQKSVNGSTQTLYLCKECASKINLSLFAGWELDPFWGQVLSTPVSPSSNPTRCNGCGHSFREIVSIGHAVCPQCYTTFYDQLLPSIERIHGKTNHVGKHQKPATTEEFPNTLEMLTNQLKECIQRQEYEKCATLRDQIRHLEEIKKEES